MKVERWQKPASLFLCVTLLLPHLSCGYVGTKAAVTNTSPAARAVLKIKEGIGYDATVSSESSTTSGPLVLTIINEGSASADNLAAAIPSSEMFVFCGESTHLIGAYPGYGGTCSKSLAPGTECTVAICWGPPVVTNVQSDDSGEMEASGVLAVSSATGDDSGESLQTTFSFRLTKRSRGGGTWAMGGGGDTGGTGTNTLSTNGTGGGSLGGGSLGGGLSGSGSYSGDGSGNMMGIDPTGGGGYQIQVATGESKKFFVYDDDTSAFNAKLVRASTDASATVLLSTSDSNLLSVSPSELTFSQGQTEAFFSVSPVTDSSLVLPRRTVELVDVIAKVGSVEVTKATVEWVNRTCFDFGTSGSPVKSKHVKDTGTVFTDASGYGFTASSNVTAYDRGGTDALLRDGAWRGGSEGSFNFLFTAPNGPYWVMLHLGDNVSRDYGNSIEGSGLGIERVSAGVTKQQHAFVDLSDGQLNVEIATAGIAYMYNKTPTLPGLCVTPGFRVPRVVGLGQSWQYVRAGDPVVSVIVRLNGLIDDSTLSSSDFMLRGPANNPIIATEVSATSDPMAWEVKFPGQSVTGTYTVIVGPHLKLKAPDAREMDENNNGIPGESTDIWSGSFEVKAFAALKYDFGGAQVEDGYTNPGETTYSVGVGHGWSSSGVLPTATDKGGTSLLERDFVRSNAGGGTFSIYVPNGRYEVSYISTDGALSLEMSVTVSGVWGGLCNQPRCAGTVTVNVTNRLLNVAVSSLQPTKDWVLNALEIKPVD